MALEWQKGIVIKIEQATASTKRFWIEFPDKEVFDFIPGQFITLDLPIHPQRNKRWRSYSIASMPDGTNVVELIIVLLEGGSATTYLFNEVKVGTELNIRGPQGVFVLPENADIDIFMVCTGTGIAPFRSMVNYMKQHNLPHKNIHLICGTRTKADLLYEDEMRDLQATMPNFTYHPVLSREEREGYHHGYVHAVYEKLSEAKPPAYFMLCGWKVMIDEAKERILNLGYDKKDIQLELYG